MVIAEGISNHNKNQPQHWLLIDWDQHKTIAIVSRITWLPLQLPQGNAIYLQVLKSI